jgi:hypothetical protein
VLLAGERSGAKRWSNSACSVGPRARDLLSHPSLVVCREQHQERATAGEQHLEAGAVSRLLLVLYRQGDKEMQTLYTIVADEQTDR